MRIVDVQKSKYCITLNNEPLLVRSYVIMGRSKEIDRDGQTNSRTFIIDVS